MKITRKVTDGSVKFGTTPETQTQMEITLTEEEIERIYRERRHYYNCEDIKAKIEDMIEEYEGEPEEQKLRNILADEKKIGEMADWFDEALSDNDSFMESFWIIAEYIIKDTIDEEE